ncbi:MAG: hypothetical protein FWH10_08540 [Oscillospiraceae bacterium]|nr:hypothetical protein [Oscillospiraceae bacterium]
MIRKELTRTVTIWPRWFDRDNTQGVHTAHRRVLRFCSWDDSSILTSVRTGNILQEPTTIRIFEKTSGLKFVTRDEWFATPQDMLDGLWTVDLLQQARPIIAGFESEMEFAPDTSGRMTNAMNNYRDATSEVIAIQRMNDNRKGLGSHIYLQGG